MICAPTFTEKRLSGLSKSVRIATVTVHEQHADEGSAVRFRRASSQLHEDVSQGIGPDGQRPSETDMLTARADRDCGSDHSCRRAEVTDQLVRKTGCDDRVRPEREVRPVLLGRPNRHYQQQAVGGVGRGPVREVGRVQGVVWVSGRS